MSTFSFTSDAVPWSSIQEGRGQRFRGDPRGRWMVLREQMIGPGEAMLLNDLYLWDLTEVLLESRRVDFGDNDGGHLRGESHCRRCLSGWGRWWRLKTLPLIRLLQRLWRQWILLVCPERRQVSSKE